MTRLGGGLHHHIDGPDDGEVLVLGPSLGTDLHLFDAQAAALSDQFLVIRYDLPGHGQSPLIPPAVTVPHLAAAVLAMLDDLHIDRFTYAGVSLGGAIGLQLAIDAPERLQRLVVIASAARFADTPSWSARADRVREEGTEFLVPSRTGAWFTTDFAREHPGEVDRLLAMLRTVHPEGYATCCEATGAFDARAQLPAITAPTLVIAGAEDPATTPTTVRAIADAIPHAHYLSVPHASHLVSAEHPDTISNAVRAHLTGTP